MSGKTGSSCGRGRVWRTRGGIWVIIPEVKWRASAASDPHAFEAYRESLRDLYEVTDVAGVESRFEAHGHALLFDDIVLALARGPQCQFERTVQGIRRSGLDSFSLVLDLAGTVGDRDGRAVKAGPGGLHVVDYARPMDVRPLEVDAINLVLPRARAADWLLRPDMHGFVLAPDGAGARLITAHLKGVMAWGPALTAEEGVTAIEAALHMMASCMGEAPPMEEAQARTSYRTVRQMATRYMDEHLFDLDLSPDAIALDIGISRATLYRAFDTLGGVRDHIRGRRLDRAYQVLGRRAGRTPSVADVAYSHGFVSAQHFNRAFRSRFGLPPGDVTLWSKAGALADATTPDESARLATAAEWVRRAAGMRRPGNSLEHPGLTAPKAGP